MQSTAWAPREALGLWSMLTDLVLQAKEDSAQKECILRYINQIISRLPGDNRRIDLIHSTY